MNAFFWVMTFLVGCAVVFLSWLYGIVVYRMRSPSLVGKIGEVGLLSIIPGFIGAIMVSGIYLGTLTNDASIQQDFGVFMVSFSIVWLIAFIGQFAGFGTHKFLVQR